MGDSEVFTPKKIVRYSKKYKHPCLSKKKKKKALVKPKEDGNAF